MSDETIDAEIVERNALAKVEYLPATSAAVDEVVKRMGFIQELMRKAMIPNIDYGQIPGTNSNPTLLKSGAEKICVMFRLCPKYRTEKTWDGQHLTVETTCTICDLQGHELGQASSMCSTRESKYAYRKGERKCPDCGKPAIIKGKAEYGGGFLCWQKKGGCGAKFAENDLAITSQTTERVMNEDLADSYNTVLRISEKRAYIACVRLVTGSSALFDEEMPQAEHEEQPHEQSKPASKPIPPAAIPVAWVDAIARVDSREKANKLWVAFEKEPWVTSTMVGEYGAKLDARIAEVEAMQPAAADDGSIPF